MSKYNKKKKQQKSKQQAHTTPPQPWIAMKTGLRVVAVASVAMAVLTAWQAIPALGVGEGILWGLVYGGMVWLVFWGYYLFHKFIRRIRSR